MNNLYIVSDSQGRSIGLFDDLDKAKEALLDHAFSFLDEDDIVLVEPTPNPDHKVLRVVAYIEGFDMDMCIEEVVTINEVV